MNADKIYVYFFFMCLIHFRLRLLEIWCDKNRIKSLRWCRKLVIVSMDAFCISTKHLLLLELVTVTITWTSTRHLNSNNFGTAGILIHGYLLILWIVPLLRKMTLIYLILPFVLSNFYLYSLIILRFHFVTTSWGSVALCQNVSISITNKVAWLGGKTLEGVQRTFLFENN